jgi:hypothetical protein
MPMESSLIFNCNFEPHSKHVKSPARIECGNMYTSFCKISFCVIFQRLPHFTRSDVQLLSLRGVACYDEAISFLD